MNEVRRENKRLKEKLVSVSESKRKSVEENAQSQTLLQSYKEANSKLFEEMQSNQALQGQLDAMNANFKKLQAQYVQVKEEHDQLKRSRKEEDKIKRLPLTKPTDLHSKKESVLVTIPRNTADVPKPSSIKPFEPSPNLRNPFSTSKPLSTSSGVPLRKGPVDSKSSNTEMAAKRQIESASKAPLTSPPKTPFNLSAKKRIQL